MRCFMNVFQKGRTETLHNTWMRLSAVTLLFLQLSMSCFLQNNLLLIPSVRFYYTL